jgi:curved DNA-binding protein CbpA
VSAPGGGDPFTALGLPSRAGLTDDDVRAAWRRLATATHPDRSDGGDPARFAAAAAAYTVLRTRSGRGEALADLAELAGRTHRPGRPAAGTRRRGGTIPAGRPAGPAATQPAVPGRGPGTEADDAGRPARQAARPGPAPAGPSSRTRRAARDAGPQRLMTARLVQRARRGRPARLALRVLLAVAIGIGVAAVAGLQPATPALWTGILTWFLLTARHDLAPPT